MCGELSYDKQVHKRETYTFTINRGGELFIQEEGEVVVIFINDKFDSATYPARGTYSRNMWRILSEIEREITKIEKGKGKI
jgi:hypothetical protein